MKSYHKQTVMIVSKSDFFDKGQEELKDFLRTDLNTPDKRQGWIEASFVLLQATNGDCQVLKSRY